MLALLTLLACKGSDEPPASSAEAAVTWYRDVAPVVDRHCARCHDGEGLGPGNFRDYDTVASLAPLMLQRVDAGEMPPPAADPECQPYDGGDVLTLDTASRDLLAQWVDAGAPAGDPADASTVTAAVDHLEQVDVTLTTAAPYTPDFVDNNEYRCFILDWDEADDTYITAFEAVVDHAEISHHTVLYAALDEDAPGYVTDPATQSWKCGITPDNDWEALHAWAPGNNPVRLAPGTGLKIPGGSQLVLQMHYYNSGPGAATTQDRPSYHLTTAASVDKEVYYFPIGPDDFTIPAGDPSYTATDEYKISDLLGLPMYATFYGVFPHMHVLGKAYHMYGKTPDGTEKCLARAETYDFANQPTYWFTNTVELGPDDTLGVSCTWDNSAGNPAQINDTPQDVSFGENTDQEMCFGLFYVSLAFLPAG